MTRSPFDFEHADPWSSDLIDVESLNAHVSDLIVSRVAAVSETARLGPDRLRTTSLLALGPAGSGKTHLFVRIRRKCGPRAAFVMLRPELGVDATPRHVLNALIDALGRPASDTTDRQLDVVVGSMLASFSGERGPHVLLEHYRDGPIANREELIARGLDEVERHYPEVFMPYLEQLLRTPFLEPVNRRASMHWLSGREPSEANLARIGLPAGLGDSDILPALRTLGIVASYGAPIVLVFDQLENLFDPDSGSNRIHSYAHLVSELFDGVRGLVIVQLALEAEWRARIRPLLSDAQRSRLESTLVEMSMPSAEQREELVRAWVSRLPEAERVRPFPWPFSKAQLADWCSAEGMTPRRLMIACREALLAGPTAETVEPAPSSSRGLASAVEVEDANPDRLEQLWQEELMTARHTRRETAADQRGLDGDQIVAGLLAAFRFVTGASAQPKRVKNTPTLVVDSQNGSTEIWVTQQLHPRSVAASVQHASEAAAKRRVVVVRERSLPFPPTWRRVEEHARALREAGGEIIWLDPEEAAQLLAIHDFLASARSQDLTQVDGRPIELARVEDWLRASADVGSWPLFGRILGAATVDETSAEVERIVAEADSQPPPPPKPTLVREDGAALGVLRRLRVASVERVIREALRENGGLGRADVVSELHAAGPRVRWFGRMLVALSEVAS